MSEIRPDADAHAAILGFNKAWHKELKSARLAARWRLIKRVRADTRYHATNNSTLPDLHRLFELVCLKLLEWGMRLQKDAVRKGHLRQAEDAHEVVWGRTMTEDQAKCGRPTAYTKEIGERIFGRRCREGIRSVWADPYMPDMATFYRWLREHKELQSLRIRMHVPRG